MSDTITTADINIIRRAIPHRYPFLLVDKVVEIDGTKRGVGVKNVTVNEPFFQGHFPARPVMPGVLIIEAMAQTSAVLVVDTMGLADQGLLVYFMTLDKARFRKTVMPGDRLELHVKILRGRGKVWKFTAEGSVDGTVVAEAEYAAMIVSPEEAREKG